MLSGLQKTAWELGKMHCIIHIGPAKTGSTSIQSFLNLNRDRLAAQHYFYPIGESQVHRELILFCMREVAKQRPGLAKSGVQNNADLENLRPAVESTIRAWLTTAKSEGKTIILSAEGLVYRTREEVGILHDLLAEYCETFRVVTLLRRQDLSLNSKHKNMVRNFAYTKFDETDIGLKYSDALINWEEVFGAKSFHPAIFPDSGINTLPLVETFLKAAGMVLENLQDFEQPGIRNANWDGRALNLLQRINSTTKFSAGQIAPPSRKLLERAILEWFPEPKPFRMPRDHAEHICRIHAADNAAVARRYFQRDELFHNDFSMYDNSFQGEPSHEDYARLLANLADIAARKIQRPNRR